LSLPVDGSEDHLLKIQDCPNLTISDWQRALEGTAKNPALIDNNVEDTIKVNDNDQGLLYTAQEVEEGITIKGEDENEVTTDSEVELEDIFDPDSQSDFDDDINGNEDLDDENM